MYCKAQVTMGQSSSCRFAVLLTNSVTQNADAVRTSHDKMASASKENNTGINNFYVTTNSFVS